MMPQAYPLYTQVEGEYYAVAGWDEDTWAPYLIQVGKAVPGRLFLINPEVDDDMEFMTSIAGRAGQ